jgi:hypothetical protein
MPFYGSRISSNISRSKPEGYLIAHNCAIARTGWQEYSPAELGVNDDRPIVRVYRSAEEVFSPATMASFEGKPVVEGHPSEDVNPFNHGMYAKGHVQNVRKGAALESGDLPLVADLVINDSNLISQVEPSDGLRELSCGYNRKLVSQPDGTYLMTNIVGNHVAIVNRGRAGPHVSIRDHATPVTVTVTVAPKKSLRRTTTMDIKALSGRILKVFSTDADSQPEDVAAAARLLSTDAAPEKKEEPVKDSSSDAQLKLLTDAVSKLVDGFAKKSKDEAAEKEKAEKEK